MQAAPVLECCLLTRPRHRRSLAGPAWFRATTSSTLAGPASQQRPPTSSPRSRSSPAFRRRFLHPPLRSRLIPRASPAPSVHSQSAPPAPLSKAFMYVLPMSCVPSPSAPSPRCSLPDFAIFSYFSPPSQPQALTSPLTSPSTLCTPPTCVPPSLPLCTPSAPLTSHPRSRLPTQMLRSADLRTRPRPPLRLRRSKLRPIREHPRALDDIWHER